MNFHFKGAPSKIKERTSIMQIIKIIEHVVKKFIFCNLLITELLSIETISITKEKRFINVIDTNQEDINGKENK